MKTPELNAKERKVAILYALNLLALLKSVTQGVETIEDRKFSSTMTKLREELDGWGFETVSSYVKRSL